MVVFQHLEKWLLRVLDPANAWISAERQAQWQQILRCCARVPEPRNFSEFYFRYYDTEYEHDCNGDRIYTSDDEEEEQSDDEEEEEEQSELERSVRHMFALMECAGDAQQKQVVLDNGRYFDRVAFLVALDDLNMDLRATPSEQMDGLKADLAQLILPRFGILQLETTKKKQEPRVTLADGRVMSGKELIMASFRDYYDCHGDCGWYAPDRSRIVRKMYELLADHCFPGHEKQCRFTRLCLPDNSARTRQEMQKHFGLATDEDKMMVFARYWNIFSAVSGRHTATFAN